MKCKKCGTEISKSDVAAYMGSLGKGECKRRNMPSERARALVNIRWAKWRAKKKAVVK